MAKGRIVAAIDLGSKYIRCVVAEYSDSSAKPELTTLGVSRVQSKGISNGEITDIQEASASIKQAIKEAEQEAGAEVRKAYIAVDGINIKKSIHIGSATIQDNTITENDKRKANDAVAILANAKEVRTIQTIPLYYTVDGSEETLSPVGLSGSRLEFYAMVVQSSTAKIENISKTIEEIGIELEEPNGILLSTWYAANCIQKEILKDDLHDIGVLYMDLGHSITNIAITINGKIKYCTAIKLGFQDLKKEIVNRFGIHPNDAENLLVNEGLLESVFDINEEELEQEDAVGYSNDKTINARSIASNDTFIQIKKSEFTLAIADKIYRQLNKSVQASFAIANGQIGLIMIAGGMSMIPGIDKFLHKAFKKEIKICRERDSKKLPERWETSEYAIAYSVLKAETEKTEKKKETPAKPDTKTKFKSLYEKIMNFLEEMF